MAHTERLARHLFPVLGWRRIEYLEPASTHWYAIDEGDGAYLERDEELIVRYDRSAAVVASEALNLTLNLQGQPTSRDAGAIDPPVSICGFRGNPGISPYVAFAQEIRVGEGLPLPWMLVPDMLEQLPWIPPEQAAGYDGQVVIFAGSVQTFLWALYEDAAFVNMIALEAIKNDFPDSWQDWEYGQPEFDEGAARATITIQVTQAFAPELLRIRERYYNLVRLLRPLNQAVWATDSVASAFARHVGKHQDLAAWCSQPLVRLIRASLYILRRRMRLHLNRLGRRASIPPHME